MSIFFMNERLTVAFSIAILLTVTVVTSVDFSQTADAVKSKGNSLPEVGSSKVCGDRLCTPDDFAKDGAKKEFTLTGQASVSSDIAMSKMDRLFELHRMQLLSAWDSLNDSEKSHMMNMFDKMYEKMESMDFRDHMKHMSKMMDGKHHDYKDNKHGCSCGEGEHGCSCGEGEHGCSCGEGEHGCSCGEGCTCASCH